LELLDQIQQYIQEMIEIAKDQNLAFLLVESYFLDIKLNLIFLDFNKIQETLTEVQKIAEKLNLSHLIKRLSREREIVTKQKDRIAKIERPYNDNTIIEFSEIEPLRMQIICMLKKRELFKSIKI
jgi:hypothetical protein